jgi:hypothetical protein
MFSVIVVCCIDEDVLKVEGSKRRRGINEALE